MLSVKQTCAEIVTVAIVEDSQLIQVCGETSKQKLERNCGGVGEAIRYFQVISSTLRCRVPSSWWLGHQGSTGSHEACFIFLKDLFCCSVCLNAHHCGKVEAARTGMWRVSCSAYLG